MSKIRKFGTFSGVFTPSILTILGVIMYLRLPWIIGQAGLYYTLFIILIAHLISATTGLSVASIATDKKVKTGGTYYMISRSLGLPIGGTLGIALFVGLSFSVSLYLIGFAESFLSYWGFEVTKNTIRIAGSAMLFIVTTITFISTSLAIKSQYIIMTAIALSLLSIFFGSHEFQPSEPNLMPIATAAPFMLLFGIFFPAVTGFEAGVSMSGDLQDPKRSLPIGTILAVVVGLVAYIGLTVFFSFTVDSEALLDSKVLLNISLVPELVIAGIWGATLSSALGSILGAPRILQATAIDKITPRVFAKGFGAANEPRNALLLAFVIAEAGILIGSLDLIARVVSMFFITTYGFLNLSCAIESWASSDFRPEFKVPRIVSVIGALACFLVMIQLDFVAFTGATVVLGVLFLYLKRKELLLERGDSWESVWASLVRTGLYKLSKSQKNIRNWRPNILLFSGEEHARPYLKTLGKSISGRMGIMSDFELIENPASEEPISKLQKQLQSTDQEAGLNRHTFECQNIYEGIGLISTIYGFSGIEPNTVLMGWAGNSSKPENFTSLLKKFSGTNYNLMMLDFDKKKEFGNKKQIDIWWRGFGRNLSFALSISRHLTNNPEWRSAKIRILHINPDSIKSERIHKNLNQLLEDARIYGEIKIINNNVENRSPFEIIQTESQNADLTILGITEVRQLPPEKYIESVNKLNNSLGSILLINASTFFEEIRISGSVQAQSIPKEFYKEAVELPNFEIIGNDIMRKRLVKVWNDCSGIYQSYFEQAFFAILNEDKQLLKQLSKIVISEFSELKNSFEEYKDDYRLQKSLHKTHNDFLYKTKKWIEYYKTAKLTEYHAVLETANEWVKKQIEDFLLSVPELVSVVYTKDDFKTNKDDNWWLKFYKFRKRANSKIFNIKYSSEIAYRELVRYYVFNEWQKSQAEILNQFGLNSCKFIASLRKLNANCNDTFKRTAKLIHSGQTPINEISEHIKITEIYFEKFIESSEKIQKSQLNKSLNSFKVNIEELGQELGKLRISKSIKKKQKTNKTANSIADENLDFAAKWLENLSLFSNINWLDVLLFSLQERANISLEKVTNSIQEYIDSAAIQRIKKLENLAEKELNNENIDSVTVDSSLKTDIKLHSLLTENQAELKKILQELPDSVLLSNDKFTDDIENHVFSDADKVKIPLLKSVNYHIDADFYSAVHEQALETENTINDAVKKLQETTSLANFNLQNLNILSGYDERKNITNQNLNLILKQCKETTKNINEATEVFKSFIINQLKIAFEPLNSYAIQKNNQTQTSKLVKKDGKSAFSKIKTRTSKINSIIKKAGTRLLYAKVESVLLANQFIDNNENTKGTVAETASITEKYMPDTASLAKLPFYYKNLFSGKAYVSDDFWISRQEENEAKSYVKRYKSTGSGAMLVTGTRNSGKTSFCNHIAKHAFSKEKIYFLAAPKANTSDLREFKKQFNKALNQNSLPENIVVNLPKESVIIINDLELWWDRTIDGNAVIEYIIELLSCANCYFIVNANEASFNFINKTIDIKKYFSGVVNLKAVGSEMLKNAVLTRHKTSGLSFVFAKSHEESISEWKSARLFNKLFSLTNGNIGFSFNTWIASVRNMKKEIFEIELPQAIPNEFINRFDDEWIAILINFILHRRIQVEKISEIMLLDTNETKHTLTSMERAGLLENLGNDIFAINEYIEAFVLKQFKGKGVI